MESLQADQLIFSNVEADESPHRRRGYQILFCSESISREEQNEIEPRLTYKPHPDHLVKRVYFTLSSGRVVLAQIVPLSGTDRFGREGRYLAHALVLADRDFAGLECHPFPIFRSFPFFKRLEDVFVQGDRATGAIPPVMLRLPEQLPETAASHEEGSWAATSGLQLAARADRLLADRVAVGLFGSAEMVNRTLESLWPLLPLDWRRKCSFDTHFGDGTLSRQPFWAIGQPADMPRAANLFAFDLRPDAPPTPTPKRLEPSLFDRWLESAGRSRSMTAVRPELDGAQAWTHWLEGGLTIPENSPASRRVFAELLRLSGDSIRRRVHESLHLVVPPTLAPRIRREIDECLDGDADALLHLLNEGLDHRRIGEWLWKSFSLDPKPPGPQELEGLYQLLQRPPSHPLLTQAYYFWIRNSEHFLRSLLAMSEEDFSRFLPWWIRVRRWNPQWGFRWFTNGVVIGAHLAATGPDAAAVGQEVAAACKSESAQAFIDTPGKSKPSNLLRMPFGKSDPDDFLFHAAPTGPGRRRLLLMLQALIEWQLAEERSDHGSKPV